PPNTQYWQNSWPIGWSSNRDTYTNLVLPYCDTCHMAMDTNPVRGNVARPATTTPSATYSAINGFPSFQNHVRAYGASYLGVTSAGQFNTTGGRATLKMPQAQLAFQLFWGENGGTDCYGDSDPFPRAPADCFFRDLGIWTDRPGGGNAMPSALT